MSSSERDPGVPQGQEVLEGGTTNRGQVVRIGDTVRRPWRLRFGETMRHLDEAGLRAFGLVALLGFLIGLILAFQSSVSLRRFGAEYYIPNLVGISLLRELGPLMAAVVLAGRTGSAFAAPRRRWTISCPEASAVDGSRRWSPRGKPSPSSRLSRPSGPTAAPSPT